MIHEDEVGPLTLKAALADRYTVSSHGVWCETCQRETGRARGRFIDLLDEIIQHEKASH